MRSKEPPVQMVCRRMNFTYGIPAEYKWVTREVAGISTFRVQKLTPDVWLAAVAREEASGTGHIGPAVVEEANETNAGEPGVDGERGTGDVLEAEREEASAQDRDSDGGR